MRPTKEYEGYIFDCDGTLADSMPVHHDAWVKALEENGAQFDFTFDLMCSWGGKSMFQTVHDLNDMFEHALDAAEVAAAQARYVADFLKTVQGREEVVGLARELADVAPMAVASGGHRNNVHTTLTAIGVIELFRVIVTHEDVTQSKPSPEMFLLAADRLGVKPQNCLVYEDSPTGVEAAKAAGMDWVLVD